MTIDVDIPPSLKKRSEVYKNAYDEPNPVGEGFPIVSGLFKTMRAIDTSRHTIETSADSNGNVITSIAKRPQVPSTQALAVVSQKLSAANIYNPSKIETVGDIANISQNQYVANVSQNKSVRPSKKQNKNPFGDTPIYDTSYREMTEEILSEIESSGKYKVSKASRPPTEVPRKASKEANTVWITGEDTSRPEFAKAQYNDARKLGLAQRSKSPEPSSISVISDSKQKIRESLKKRPAKQVTASDAFDFLVNQFRVKDKPVKKDQTPKVKHSLKSNIIRGIQDINQITEEISKNGNIQRIKQQQEADFAGLRVAHRHFKGSIAACANSKKGITAGSLVTQRTIGTRTNAQAVAPYPSQNQVIPKVIHRKGGDIVRYFLPNGREVSAADRKSVV